MTNIQKENIAEGFATLGLSFTVIGFFVTCAEFIFSNSNWPVIGFVMMIGGLVLMMGSLTYQAFKGWL